MSFVRAVSITACAAVRPAVRRMVPPALGSGLRRWGVLAALLPLAAGAAEPIAPRDWGGEPTVVAAESAQRIERITLHHQGERWKPDADPAAYLRRLQSWSRLSKRWPDIPYHYVIAPDGRVFEARPEALPGDTNTGYDPRGHALVMLLGNFEEQEPTAAQLEATVALMTRLARRHGIPADRIASHRDVSDGTVCPGAHLWPLLPQLRDQVRQALAAPAGAS